MVNKIRTACAAQEVERIIGEIAQDVTVFCDIDNTLIGPFSLDETRFVDAVKEEIYQLEKNSSDLLSKEYLSKMTDLKEIISRWRLSRSVGLLDKDWPMVLENLKKKGSVFALSKVETGSFGHIPSMEKWRYHELLQLGITFSLLSNHSPHSPKTFDHSCNDSFSALSDPGVLESFQGEDSKNEQFFLKERNSFTNADASQPSNADASYPSNADASYPSQHLCPSVLTRFGASYCGGIFLTGCHSKSQTVAYFQDVLNLKKLVLVDDKEENLEDLQDFCQCKGIDFQGILFTTSSF